MKCIPPSTRLSVVSVTVAAARNESRMKDNKEALGSLVNAVCLD